MPSANRPVTELLIVKPSSLGDIVHGLVAAQSIRDQLPSARISWVVRDRFAPLVEGCPTVNGQVFRYQRDRGLRAIAATCRDLRAHRFDCVIDWQGLARSALMARAARAPRRIGRSDAREGARLAYSECTPLPAAGRASHALAVLLETLPLLGLQRRVGSAVSLPHTDPGSVAPALAGRAPVLLVPNSRGAHKEWPGFMDLARVLLGSAPAGLDATPIVLDSHVRWRTPADLEAAENTGRFINLGGKTDLATMIGLVHSARLVVVNDAGPLHIAAALGTPVLGLFGPTSAQRFGPYPADAAGHHVLSAPGRDLTRLTVDTVAAKVHDILAAPSTPDEIKS